jgi:hypothetical protein
LFARWATKTESFLKTTFRFLIASVALSFCAPACVPPTEPEATLPYDESRTGDCNAVAAASWAGAQPCTSIGFAGQQVASELLAFWLTEPSLICSYDPFLGGSGPCGPLSPNNAFYCSLDNSVAWDFNFMNQQYSVYGDFAPATIVAHEWGHRNQALAGLLGDPSRSTYQNEQHADCQAGVFAAYAEARGDLEPGDLVEVFNSLCAAGGTSGWFDPTSHGTCRERVSNYQWGYQQGQQRLGELCGPSPVEVGLEICQN